MSEPSDGNHPSLAAHAEVLEQYAPLRWWMDGTASAVMYWDPSDELQWWDNHSQAWHDADSDDTKEWFDVLPLATLDNLSNGTGTPGLVASLTRRVAQVAATPGNHASLSEHNAVLGRYAPLRWLEQHRAVVSWDGTEGELLYWGNELQAWDDADDEATKEWFDGLPLATEEQIRLLTGSPGMLLTLGKAKSAEMSPAADASADSNDPSLHRLEHLGQYSPLRWGADMSSVMYWDKATNELQWWNNHTQGWDDAGDDSDDESGGKAWFDSLPLATLEQVQTHTGKPGMVVSLKKQ
jgi:hypothetical protein